MIGIETGGD